MMTYFKHFGSFPGLAILGLTLFCNTAFAKVFEVSDIDIEGLQRVSAGKVFASLPISVGDLVDQETLRQATRSLFRTGNFEDVQWLEDNGRLIVRVRERPAVDQITIEGSKKIPEEDLLSSLRDQGLAEGQIFKRNVLEGMIQALKEEYVKNGLYGSTINTRTEELPRNRVAVFVDIAEGTEAAIKHINIVGNEKFSEEELTEEFELNSSNWLSWIRKDDRYSREKLNGDLDRLESHYKDRGYLRFRVTSTQVSVSPDKSAVYITINVDEGDVYKISEVKLAGELVVPEQELRRYIVAQEGATYSQALVDYSSDAITRRLGNDGYTFATVNSQPEVNDDDNNATVTFFIDPKKRVYVRRINISGNTKTADDVVRREMRQMEGAVASNWRIDRGKERLARAAFVKAGDVKVQTPEVPGVDDQIDVNYTFEEQSSGEVSASLGFSQTSGLQLGGSLTERNFLGTGREVGFRLNRNDFQTNTTISYTDPYFTVDGVSTGFNIFARSSDFAEIGLTSYETESFGAIFNFSYPLGETQRLSYGFGYENLKIDASQFRLRELGSQGVSPEILKFIDDNGPNNGLLTFNLGWRASKLDRFLFATDGYSSSLALEVAPPLLDDLAYYKLTYSGQKFFPLRRISRYLDGWSFRVRTELGYGDGWGDTPRLPFYKNFYAGGYNSVRGYERNSLGPRTFRLFSTADSSIAPSVDNTDPFGGNVLVEASAEVIFPLPFLKDQSQVQASFFFDAGNVFDTECSPGEDFDVIIDGQLFDVGGRRQENCSSPDLGELRYSFGVGATWRSPFGPITFSISRPLNAGDLDEEENFQFSLGNQF